MKKRLRIISFHGIIYFAYCWRSRERADNEKFAAKDYKTAIIIDFARSSKRKTPDALRGAGYEVEEYR